MFNPAYSTSSAPYCPAPQDVCYQRQPSWEGYIGFEPSSYALAPPAPVDCEVMAEKPPQSPQPMDVEEFTPSGDQDCYPEYTTDFEFPTDIDYTTFERNASLLKYEDYYPQYEFSQCSKSETESEAASASTKDSALCPPSTVENDAASFTADSSSYPQTPCDFEVELNERALRCLQNCNDEEAQYILRILPLLLSSLKEIYQKNQLPLDDQIVATILKELIVGKGEMLQAEQQTFRQIINSEDDGLQTFRPEAKIKSNDISAPTRKEKKSTKGHRNTSSMNHFNENYVSNIFQFARRHYPEDREVQKIGNERNVSAANFRKLIKTNLNDDIMTRKAKAKISRSGRELVHNIEHWMTDGYFEQCSDREKYIYHKEKAIRDLALSEQI